MSHPRVRTLALLAAVVGLAVLTGCAPEGGGQAAPSSTSPTSSATASPTATASTTPTPSPSGSTEATPAIPTDCRSILSESVLTQLGETPLNPPNFGPTGTQADGSVICLWRDPGADTTYLSTTISKMSSGPALDMLNGLVASDGFSCFTPDKGTRCEKTWQNTTYPVTDGRTLFYRSGILIDTTYSNLAPSGYTDSIVAHLFG